MLPQDHPGFYDLLYRSRRDKIASIANSYSHGDEVGEVPYIPEEHKVWRETHRVLADLYPFFACKEYNRAFREFDLEKDRIPQFSELNRKLSAYSFSLSPVVGLIPPREFLERLSQNTMLCTQYIRHHSIPEYTPEPDVIHEVFGHAVFFLNNNLRTINNLFGKVAQKSTDREIEKLIRLYWYTIEFGVCLENDEVKAYGAGLLSSTKELISISKVPLSLFNISEMENARFDTEQPQERLFCAKSFDQVVEELTIYLENLLQERDQASPAEIVK